MTGPSPSANLHIAQGVDGQRAMFGEIQAAWLLEHEHVERVRFDETSSQTGIHRYQAKELTATELDELVREQIELRECDFCGARPAGWLVHLRGAVELEMLAVSGPIRRPIYTCEDCMPLVRDTRKADLVDRMLDARVEQARAGGFTLPSSTTIDREVRPKVKAFVAAVVGNREGFPERADDEDPE